MKKSYFYAAWAVLYCICAGLGFVPNPEGAGKTLLVGCSFIFFLPPLLLAWYASKKEDGKIMKELRIISMIALLVDMVMIITVFISAAYCSYEAQKVISVIYLLFTAPLQCGQYWVFPLFMWSCLLMITMRRPEPK